MTETVGNDSDDHQFFDLLYQQFSLTTGAEKTYWMPEKDEGHWAGVREDDYFIEGTGWSIVAVHHETDARETIATGLAEVDADFIAGLHGALPDLIRRLHDAVAEAERADTARDAAEGLAADALLENQGLEARIIELERQLNA